MSTNQRRFSVAFGFAVALALAAGFGCGGSSESDTPTAPTVKDKDEWTHADLVAALNAKGLKLGMRDEPNTPDGTPTNAAFVFLESATFTNQHLPAKDLDDNHLTSCFYALKSLGLILVTKVATAQEAKDKAARKKERGWNWGRFLFEGDPGLIAEVKKALG